jgi:hypothetical protein
MIEQLENVKFKVGFNNHGFVGSLLSVAHFVLGALAPCSGIKTTDKNNTNM